MGLEDGRGLPFASTCRRRDKFAAQQLSCFVRQTLAPAVVLLSGGLDSATVLALAVRGGRPGGTQYACHTLAFDYGQRHWHELAAAAAVSRALGAVEHRVVTLDLRAIGGSALTADVEVPKDRSHEAMAGGAPATYVPARNMTFLAIAVGYAETLGARDVFIGVNAVDYSGYPDCRPEFIAAFERAANLGTTIGNGLRIRAPLAGMRKAEIIALGSSLGVDYAMTRSCYDPTERDGAALACGRCDSCIIRRNGFRDAGVLDPTRYT